MRGRLPQVERYPNLAVQVSEALRRGILNGAIRPGDTIKIEEVAAALGVSRTPVREAIHSLASEGYLEILPRKRVVVRRLGPFELADMYDIRALVEGYAALLAAERITSEGVARLRDNCDKLARCISEYEVGRATVLDFIEINTQFHNFIHALSGNRAINRVVALLWNLPKAYTRFYWERRERQRISLDFHMRIVDALANRRGTQAQNIMREHIMEAKDFLTQWLEIDSSGG